MGIFKEYTLNKEYWSFRVVGVVGAADGAADGAALGSVAAGAVGCAGRSGCTLSSAPLSLSLLTQHSLPRPASVQHPCHHLLELVPGDCASMTPGTSSDDSVAGVVVLSACLNGEYSPTPLQSALEPR